MFPNPHLLFTGENCILFLLLLRTAYCCTLIFSAPLQLLHESLLASFSSSSNLELNTSIHTTSSHSYSRLKISLLHSLFLTKHSFTLRISKLNSLSPGHCYLHWYKYNCFKSLKITFLIVSNSSNCFVTWILLDDPSH